MSVLGSNTVAKRCIDGAIVEVATDEYLESLGVDDYFKRCGDLKIKYFNQANRGYIAKMKELADQRDKSGDYPVYHAEMAFCMAKTFNLRYQDIVEHSLSVQNAVAIYPGLQNFEELRREFERISGKKVNAFEHHLDCILKQYAEGQLVKEYYTCTSSYCKESLDILREGGEDNARVAAARMIIYACAQSERTWWDVIFKVAGESEELEIGRPHPTIIVHGTPFEEKCADVYVEQIKIVNGINFYEAVLACYYLYWVFNLDYPAVDLETYQPFDDLKDQMTSIEEKGAAASVVW